MCRCSFCRKVYLTTSTSLRTDSTCPGMTFYKSFRINMFQVKSWDDCEKYGNTKKVLCPQPVKTIGEDKIANLFPGDHMYIGSFQRYIELNVLLFQKRTPSISLSVSSLQNALPSRLPFRLIDAPTTRSRCTQSADSISIFLNQQTLQHFIKLKHIQKICSLDSDK